MKPLSLYYCTRKAISNNKGYVIDRVGKVTNSKVNERYGEDVQINFEWTVSEKLHKMIKKILLVCTIVTKKH